MAPASSLLDPRQVRPQTEATGPGCDLPVILLGGGANALSLARSLGQEGIKVYAVNHPREHVRYSRFCTWIPVPIKGDLEDAWSGFLLGPQSDALRGAILLACSDAALTVIARHRERLEARFRLDESNREAQLCMLNKLTTYQAARAAGVPTPKFWVAHSQAQIAQLEDELVFPLIVKPLYSHVFTRRFGSKFVLVHDLPQLRDAFQTVQDARIEAMLVEMIPGPDHRLCSYYTYLDEHSNPLFDFTKRIIRRYPTNRGGACYHITDWVPEVRDVSLRLFRHVGLRGLANAEFKRDERDGQLKLIECNARFTAANCLVAASGFDLGLFVYNRLAGRPQKPLERYALGKRLWDPVDDFRSFLELWRRKELTLWQWLKSILHPQLTPYFRWDDPLPTFMCEAQRLRDRALRAVGLR
jgi:predicted ATP-grasp superfamily ATP-dependent carboligase